MDIDFRTRRLAKAFNEANTLRRNYGKPMAHKIMLRMAVLRAAKSLALVPTTPPDRLHQLIGERKGQFAVDLVHPFRLVFEPNHEPIPCQSDGGIDRQQVTAITILDVEDYH